ncbi:28S ribosomal protein S18b, mitochondrial-like [Daphnia pulex]|uniref:28S ribosomal protein S18b, mitochondrial-like n=1 Tax=Daphnia pulex TaxID=6669 RepID=UPI001EDF0C92|nr:28S ribosomal protein S18b, mitochondrial-like [Daphnia pulex]
MTARFVLSRCFSRLTLKQSVFTVPSKYVNNLPMLLKTEGIQLSFARSFAETTSDEVSTNSNPEELIVDEKNASKMRNRAIPVETSMKYLKSKGYSTTYGGDPVWVRYRRNFKGQFAPRTRKTCIRQEKLATGNPCPICRDEYLILDYRNVELLKQFISPFNGAILPTEKTGLCQTKQRELLVAILKAKDYGLITFDVPIREYDYSDYHKS